MRQIKFRAWDGEQMVSPDYVTRDGIAFWKEHGIPTSSKLLMQWTGLTDKNGVDIYEGDVLRICSPGCLFQKAELLRRVEYSESTGCYWMPLVRTVTWDRFGRVEPAENTMMPFLVGAGWSIEVIGNILQDPNLLAAL